MSGPAALQSVRHLTSTGRSGSGPAKRKNVETLSALQSATANGNTAQYLATTTSLCSQFLRFISASFGLPLAGLRRFVTNDW